MIKDVVALPVWNGRGDRTFKAYVKTEHATYSATAPAGKSRGRWEAASVPINRAAEAFPEIKQAILGLDEKDWDKADALIEAAAGKNFEKGGAQLSTAISMAVLKAAARGQVWKLLGQNAAMFPYPVGNVAGGGAHAGSTSIQEFLVIPVKSKSIEEAVETNLAVWREVGEIINRAGKFGRNDEGAWITGADDVKTLDLVAKTAEARGCAVGVDIAANQLWKGGKYVWPALGQEFDTGEQTEFVKSMAEKYKLVYIEDPFVDNDFGAWKELNKKTKALVVADDLIGTQPSRVGQVAREAAAGAVIIKPDQAGTVSKALRAVDQAKNGRLIHAVSHRSGDTPETFIADLAVGTEAPLIKCGIVGGERVSKLNRLLEIWAALSERGKPEMAKLKLK